MKKHQERPGRPGPADGGRRADVDTARLIHELQVHQIELETQREELQQARSQAEALLAQQLDLYDSAPVGYLTLGREGAIRQANLAGAHLLGAERSRLVNRPFGLFVAEADRRAFSDFLNRVFAGQTGESCVVTLPRQGSGPLVVQIEGTHSAERQECRAVVVDITERVRANQALQEAQRVLAGIFNAIPVRVFWKDRNLAYVGCNAAFARDSGFADPEDLIGRDDFQMGWRDQAELYRADDRRVMVTGLPRLLVEEPQTTPEGDTITLLTSKMPLRDAEGTIVGVLGTYIDITERKRVDEQARTALAELDASRQALLSVVEDEKQARAALSQLNVELEQRVADRTAELTAANRELDSFAYAVSHDLRAPLRAMSGFSLAILEDFGDGLPDGARGFLGQIQQASRAMGQLIDGLLVLSRSTRSEPRRDRVDLSGLATGLCRELAGSEPTRTVQWHVEDGMTVWGDLGMLEVVMRNLLGNAWKYTAGCAAPTVRVFAERDGTRIWHCVADNGAGFDMRHADRLFKPFQRLHRQDEFPGAGIGLATVLRVVNRHGGAVSATAAVGEGATFRFHLPPQAEGEVDAS
jgi:PAS domain S-box-containing protein